MRTKMILVFAALLTILISAYEKEIRYNIWWRKEVLLLHGPRNPSYAFWLAFISTESDRENEVKESIIRALVEGLEHPPCGKSQNSIQNANVRR